MAGWFTARARRRGDLEVDLVDLVEAGLPQTLTDEGDPLPGTVADLAVRLAAADAFVVVTPEYNRSFPAPLKTAIDWYYEEWQAKPVAFVAYGRESGGLHAIDQLRQIFTELHAVPLRDAVSLPRHWNLFAADGTWPKAAADCSTAATAVLDRLSWWALALRDARAARPYVP
ncbi:FMN reductase [Planomonospora parontospora subsp. parontospora]|uniref:FMN reductase n=2 Tax=Planomonospora parontospora TaxID=58119 RepID=A0AA37F462_9ACTN|nr:NAD(P)H-dependent oxidoreductase [Planomonospora parontospora]GGK64280.1 FMN reductase [Planomonospora parontospora]GII08107.1 FMN reductase [Planomonospora parontospora subsp. parontospora]